VCDIYFEYNIVTSISIARQRLGKHAHAVNTPQKGEAVFFVVRAATVAVKWCGEHATIKDGVFRGFRAKWIKRRIQLSSIEWRVEFRDASPPGYESGNRGIELSPVFGISSCRIMERKEICCEKKTWCVI
jgi:hypothetical protein